MAKALNKKGIDVKVIAEGLQIIDKPDSEIIDFFLKLAIIHSRYHRKFHSVIDAAS